MNIYRKVTIKNKVVSDFYLRESLTPNYQSTKEPEAHSIIIAEESEGHEYLSR
jgi:hypothetical protein